MTASIERMDCHSHSAYSGHGKGSVRDMVMRADELGLTTYAQTEHLVLPEGMDPTHESSMSGDIMSRYVEDVLEMRDELRAHGSDMELVLGVEADWLPGRTRELAELCQPFEYVIGSVHFLDGLPVDSADSPLWSELGVDGMWLSYIETWLDMVAHRGPIMAFAHPDLPKKYGWLPSFDLHPHYDEMARAVANEGCMVEVNTAGLRKPVGELYPSLDMLKAFHDAGVDCTIGADAHQPAEVAMNYRDAVAHMRRAGYTRIAVPTIDGDRRYVSII